MPTADPVADILRTVQTSDRLRAAAWDAAYSSDDPNAVAERLRSLPIGDSARAKLWDARFAEAAPAPEEAISALPAERAPLFGGPPVTGREFRERLRNPDYGLAEVAEEHPYATGGAMALLGGGGSIARAATSRALPVAQRAVAAAQAAGHALTPVVKYEVAHQALRAMGVPELLAVPTAMAVAGMSSGKAPASAQPAPGATAQPAPAPAPVSTAPPTVASGPRTVSARVVGSAPQAATQPAPVAASDPAPVAAEPAPAPLVPRRRPPDASHQPKSWTDEEVFEILRLKESGLSHDAAIDAVLSRRGVSASPAASTPEAPAPTAVSTPAQSAASPPAGPPPSQPGQSVPRSMSVQRIRNEVGIQARRQQAMLSEAEYTDAENLVRAGRTPEQAVQEVAGRKPATKPDTSTPEQPSAETPTELPRGVLTDELKEYVRLRQSGQTHKAAVKSLEQARALASVPGTVPVEEMRARVSRRLAGTNRTSEEMPSATPTQAPAASVETPKPARAEKPSRDAKSSGTTLATSPTIEGIQRQVNRFWASENYRVDADTLAISHAGGRAVPTGVEIQRHRNGYRFVSTSPTAKPAPEAAPSPAPATEAPAVSAKPAKADPLVAPDSSPEYVRALEESRAAAAKFTEVQRRYRAGQIGDDEYVAARKAFNESNAAFDRAVAKEQGGPRTAGDRMRAATRKLDAAEAAYHRRTPQDDPKALRDAVDEAKHEWFTARDIVNRVGDGGSPADIPKQSFEPAPVKPAETTVAPKTKKATKTPAAAAAQVKSQVEKVIDLQGAKSAGDVQKRVVAALEDELKTAPPELSISNAETITVKIPNDGTFTIFRSQEAINGVLTRIKRSGQTAWRGLVAGEKPLPTRTNRLPDAAFADRPWTKWE